MIPTRFKPDELREGHVLVPEEVALAAAPALRGEDVGTRHVPHVAREDLEHEIGERDDVALPGRAVQPDRGEVLAVEAREDPLDQLRPHACIPIHWSMWVRGPDHEL